MRVCAIVTTLCALMSALDQRAAYAGERCDQVVSYFRDLPGGSPGRCEWRIFDPSRRTDVPFLSLPNGVGEVHWDTTFSIAWFSSAYDLYRVDWKLGAKPVRLGPLPRVQDLVDWWFNSDSSRFQVGAISPIGSAQPTLLYRCEIWQASADVSGWKLVHADSSEGVEDLWPWDDLSFIHRAPSVTLEDLERETGYDALPVESLPFDTSTVTVGSAAASLGDEDWQFAPSSRSPRCGLAFRLLLSDRDVVSGPFYFVDLDRRVKAMLPSDPVDNDGWFDALAAERCGTWLIPGAFGHPLVVDCGSGRVVFSQPPRASSGAVWLPAPRR